MRVIMPPSEGGHGPRGSHSAAARYGRQTAALARARPAHPDPVSARAMTLREYGLVLQATDWLTFAIAVLAVPALVHAEVGPIGLVLQSGGILGSLAWKAGGLAVVYA